VGGDQFVRARRTQAERRADSERRIIEATIHTIGQKGTMHMTLADVGEAAGYSRGLPAAIFGTKENLIVQAAKSIMDQPANRTLFDAEPGDGVAEMIDLIERWFTMSIEGVGEGRGLMVLLTDGMPSEAAARSPELYQVLQAIDEAARGRFKSFLENSRGRGELRAGVDIEAEAMLILGTVRGMVWQWIINPGAFDLIRIGRVFTGQLRQRLLDG
jgi:AcrR family transcriptional regulator